MDFSKIQQRWPQLEVVYREEMDSTNDWAMAMARGSRAQCDLILVITNQQTAGRGRRGNEWSSRDGCDLTFSLLYRPDGTPETWCRLALVAACSLLYALRKSGVESEVKWPNDLWIDQKKCAGILVETTGEFAVVGMGINVNGELRTEDGHDRTTVETQKGGPLDRVDLLEDILAGYFGWMERDDFPAVIEMISPYFALSGQKISFQVGSQVRKATVHGIGPRGGLLLEGGEEVIQAHEVRLDKKG